MQVFRGLWVFVELVDRVVLVVLTCLVGFVGSVVYCGSVCMGQVRVKPSRHGTHGRAIFLIKRNQSPSP